MRIFRKIYDKLDDKLNNYVNRDYHAAIREIEVSIVRRYSRGNVLLQQGKYMTAEEHAEMSKKGTEAIEWLVESLKDVRSTQ